ncbi:MAG: response regulator [Deltaproteobacteria bacterium]|nr:response regulator [Deltaproteobacteria bacterium]
MTGQKILVVEDDKKISDLLCDYFKQSGFDVSVLENGNQVVPEVKRNPPALIVLDIMLPGKDGMSICRELRSFSKVPVLMLTAKVDEIDRILGLELGADDYICKPFSPREVVARAKAILRRTYSHGHAEEKIFAGPVTIDPEGYNVTIEGKILHLTPNEFDLLRLMAARPDHVFSRNELVSILQRDDDFDGSVRIIDSHIKNLRKKMDEVIPGNDLIHTVYGLGYSFNLPKPADIMNK